MQDAEASTTNTLKVEKWGSNDEAVITSSQCYLSATMADGSLKHRYIL